jgi:lysophospholipase L1-like esterase
MRFLCSRAFPWLLLTGLLCAVSGAWLWKQARAAAFRPGSMDFHAADFYQGERSEYLALSPKPGGVVFVGDSLTWYPLVYLARRYAEGGDVRGWGPIFDAHAVVNMSIPGDAVRPMRSRIADVGQFRPRRVVILAGVNDLNANGPVEPVGTEYGLMIDEARRAAPGAEIVSLSVLPTCSDDPRFSNERIGRLNLAIRAAAESHGAHYVVLWPSLAENGRLPTRLALGDGIHPNVAGVDRWADIMLPLARD